MSQNYLTIYSVLKNNCKEYFLVIAILILVFISPSILSAQGNTIEINIVNKQYEPPAKTLKIPQEFKDKEARFVVRVGDFIKICNTDKFFAKPTSLSKENKFQGIEGPGGLPPGNCITIKTQNPDNKPISFWLHDDIHTRSRLHIVVLPANWPDEGEENTPPEKGMITPDISESWKFGKDWVYSITQNGSDFTWFMENKNENGKGKLKGNSISAKWSGNNGSGSESGTVKFDDNGKATEIVWGNGVVFKKN